MLGSKRVAHPARTSRAGTGAAEERRAGGEADERKEQTLGGTLFERLGGEDSSPGSAFLRLFYDERHCQRRIFITVTAERLFTCSPMLSPSPVKPMKVPLA